MIYGRAFHRSTLSHRAEPTRSPYFPRVHRRARFISRRDDETRASQRDRSQVVIFGSFSLDSTAVEVEFLAVGADDGWFVGERARARDPFPRPRENAPERRSSSRASESSYLIPSGRAAGPVSRVGARERYILVLSATRRLAVGQ